ncbi:MAG TPA: aldo/keto reductase [Thermoanaerobaculia bacterium]|nr:aldo/keto reductase [Thermoanaerobaculia bacterium]HQN08878.1 aldo/keto reductase [Thermoanaerobaculia bacterium]HQP86036.1 aldo/keto reductase [Thermoanaerobaculia bacterium]
MQRIGTTSLQVFPVCLGGNVFGWTATEAESFAVLDAYFAAGGNFVDTADVYSAWKPGNSGGESEEILGRFMASRGNRDRVVVATKVGKMAGLSGLSAATIRKAAEDSLRRLRIDRIDLYYAHADDPATPLEETLGAFDALVREGKVREIAASNYAAPRLAEALAVSRRLGLARYVALQPHYNLVHRAEYEGELQALCVREGLAVFPYYALASGFLAGKYRPGRTIASVRSGAAAKHLDEPGLRVLAALDAVAAERGTTVASIALAWLLGRPGVVAPIASARTPEQLAEILPAATLSLTAEESDRLEAASRPHGG